MPFKTKLDLDNLRIRLGEDEESACDDYLMVQRLAAIPNDVRMPILLRWGRSQAAIIEEWELEKLPPQLNCYGEQPMRQIAYCLPIDPEGAENNVHLKSAAAEIRDYWTKLVKHPAIRRCFYSLQLLEFVGGRGWLIVGCTAGECRRYAIAIFLNKPGLVPA